MIGIVDTPGFMVGPDSDAKASVRKMNKLFVTAASVTVPYFTVIVRKAYGLGAQAMSGGSMMGGEKFCVAWPTAEFGPMGLEGAVMLGFSKELAKARKEGMKMHKAYFGKK